MAEYWFNELRIISVWHVLFDTFLVNMFALCSTGFKWTLIVYTSLSNLLYIFMLIGITRLIIISSQMALKQRKAHETVDSKKRTSSKIASNVGNLPTTNVVLIGVVLSIAMLVAGSILYTSWRNSRVYAPFSGAKVLDLTRNASLINEMLWGSYRYFLHKYVFWCQTLSEKTVCFLIKYWFKTAISLSSCCVELLQIL